MDGAALHGWSDAPQPRAPPIRAPEPTVTSTSSVHLQPSSSSGQPEEGLLGLGPRAAVRAGARGPGAATDVAQPAAAGLDTSPRPVFQPFCAEQRVPGLSWDARASRRADSSSPPHPPNGGAVGEGPDGRVHGPNGAVASGWAPRGGRGHLGPPWAGLGGRAGPLKVGTTETPRFSCSQIRRPSAGPRCASGGRLTRGGVPRAQTTSNAVRLDPNGAQVPELCGALGVGLRRRCRKTPYTAPSDLEVVQGSGWGVGSGEG